MIFSIKRIVIALNFNCSFFLKFKFFFSIIRLVVFLIALQPSLESILKQNERYEESTLITSKSRLYIVLALE